MIAHGKTTTNDIIPLLLDANGNVIVSASQLTTTGGKIRIDASGNLYVLPTLLTSSGSAIGVNTNNNVIVDGESPSLFRPIPKSTYYANTTLPAAGGTFTVVTVPAGENWRLTMTVIQYNGAHAPPAVGLQINFGGGGLYFHYVPAATPYTPYIQVCNVLMKPGTVITVIIGAVNLNDSVYVQYIAERVF